MNTRRSNRSMSLAMLAITMLSLALNSFGIRWDRGLYLHPDERFVIWLTSDLRWPNSIGQFFDTANSPLNPYNTQHDTFVYGTFPPFLMKAVAGLFDMDSYGEIYLVGRWISAIAAAATVLLTMVIARRFVDDRGALLAGFLMIFSPMLMQSAHFATVDSVAVFFVVAVLAATLQAWERKSIPWAILAGVMVGLAGASKPNYLLTALFVGLPALEQIRLRGWPSLLRLKHRDEYPAILGTAGAGIAAIIAFRIGQPYAFAGPHFWDIRLNDQWVKDLSWWQGLLQRGLVDYKPMVQWADRTPVLYITSNLVFWAMGATVGITALAALTLATVRLLQSATWPSWWWIGIVSWCGGHLVFYGTGLAQNQRYLMSIQPFLYILAAWLLWQVFDHIPNQRLGYAIMAVVAGYTMLYGVAFASIWAHTNSRIEASEWMFQNIPAGAMVSAEYWDDSLPMALPGFDRNQYQYMTLDIYGDEATDASKVTTLVGQLSQVDYIILSSNRVIDSVARQPDRYPVANRFYEMLLGGELGYEPVLDITRGPSVFGLEWNDLSAEESLLVYDHPQVRIFKKTSDFSPQHVYDELNSALGEGGLYYIPGDPTPDQMLLSDDALASSNQHGSWQDQFGDGFVQRHPLVFWWLAIQLLSLLAWPLMWRIFGTRLDLGMALAKVSGPLAFAAVTLALVAYTPATYSRSTILLAILVIVMLGVISMYRRPRSFLDDIRAHVRAILIAEVVFTFAFMLVAGLRGWQRILPDAELGQFTSVMRSSDLPPLDLWFSGGVLHAYWAALLPWATLGRLLGVEPMVAYGLTIATVVALAAVLVGTIVVSLTRSRLALIAPVVIVVGSGLGFTEGLAPQWLRHNVSLSMLCLLPIIAMLLLTLVDRQGHARLPLLVTALALGAVMAGAEWGVVAGFAVLAPGLVVPLLQQRVETDPWWPMVRRLLCEIVGIAALAVIFWYPAISAHTATYRNLVTPDTWSIETLTSALGAMLFLALLLMTFGASRALTETFQEGWPGILTAVIATGVVVMLLGVAVVADSALLIVVVVSLLTLTALWHWLHDATMQWVIAFVLLSMGLVVFAQARPAHVGLNGDIVTEQLLPVAWMLLVIAVSVGAISLVQRVPVGQRRYAGVAVAIVIALIVVPTISASRDTIREGDWSGAGSPSVVASDVDLAAAAWLQEQPGMPVILGIPDAHVELLTVSAQPSVLTSTNFAFRTRPGWSQMVERRRTDITTIYASLSDWGTAAPLLDRYRVNYILVGPTERLQIGPQLDQSLQMAVMDGQLEIAWQSGDLIMYRVIRP